MLLGLEGGGVGTEMMGYKIKTGSDPTWVGVDSGALGFHLEKGECGACNVNGLGWESESP